MPTIIATLVFVLAVAGMVGCAVWYRRVRSRETMRRVDDTRFNIR